MVGLVDIAVVIAFVSCFIYLKVISVTEEEKEGNDDGETEVDGRRVTGIVGLMLHTVESGSSKIEMASMGSSQTGETKVVEDVKVTSTDPNPMHQDKSNKRKQQDVVHERSSQKVAIALSKKSRSKLKKKILTSSRLKTTQNVADTTTTSEEKAKGTDKDNNDGYPDDENVISIKTQSTHTRYRSEAGEFYFENVATGDVSWELPDGGTFEDETLV